MTFMEIWGYIAAAIAAITAIVSGIKAVKFLTQPWSSIKKRIEELERHDQRDIEKFDGIFNKLKELNNSVSSLNSNNETISELQKTIDSNFEKLSEQMKQQQTELEKMNDSINFIFQTLYSVVNHEIDGNGIAHLKEIRNQLNDFIIKR